MGVTAWLSTVVVPGDIRAFDWVAALVPFFFLALGEWLAIVEPVAGADLVRERRRQQLGQSVLLGLFPLSLAVLHAAFTDRTDVDGADAIVSGLGLGLYLLGVSELLTQLPSDAALERKPLGAVAPNTSARTRRRGRRRVVAIGGVGAFLLATLGPAALSSTESPSTPEALTFTAVLGGVMATTALAAFTGSAMRRRRKPGPLRLDRVAIFVLVSLVALALLRYVYLVT